MQVIQCVCGARLEAESYDDLFSSFRRHVDSAHPDRGITDDDLRETLRKGARTSRWDGSRVAITSEVEIKPLTPDRLGDFLSFFDRDAFMDNPSWSSCYCLHYQLDDDGWETRTAEQNRADKAQLIAQGKAHGLLAYIDGKPAAWCHAAPKATLPRIANDEDLSSVEDNTIGSIVCFVVAAPYRRQGIASKLLEGACDELKRMGMSIAEAYPPGEAASDARSYHGPLDMYLSAGFQRERDVDGYVVVRRSLT